MARTVSNWESNAQAKREALLNAIPKEWRISDALPPVERQPDFTGEYIQQYLSPEEVKITETDAVGIVNQTLARKWSAVDVITAFAHRAAVAHQLVNCLHEFFFEQALEDAKALDKWYEEHKRPYGPLHGLPVSLKDQLHVKGVETTMGYVGWIDTFEGKKGTGKEKVFESELTKELRNLGVVLYVKTAVPHTLMCGETVNNIIKYCPNPKNRNLSCGGSSGGEGALMALRGSPLGFGTDIGGSIRIPAAFNGLFGLRPSTGRVPYQGIANSMDGQPSVLSVVGPLAPSVSALQLAMKSTLSQEPWLHDPFVHEIPWRDEHEEEVMRLVSQSTKGTPSLAFGILHHDGVVHPHPPVARAVSIVAKALEKAGHEVIKWQPPDHKRGTEILLKTWHYDGGYDAYTQTRLSGEPLASQLLKMFGPEAQPKDALHVASTNIARREYLKEYMDYWNSTAKLTGTNRPVDAMIMPCAPYAAVRPDRYRYLGYSGIINVLDYTSCVIPVTIADKKIDVWPGDFKSFGPEDDKDIELYDPVIFDGAFAGVQLVGRRLQEEKILALAGHISDLLTGAGPKL